MSILNVLRPTLSEMEMKQRMSEAQQIRCIERGLKHKCGIKLMQAMYGIPYKRIRALLDKMGVDVPSPRYRFPRRTTK